MVDINRQQISPEATESSLFVCLGTRKWLLYNILVINSLTKHIEDT